MKIEKDQVDSVEPFGVMNGKTVNLVRLKGGLNLATMLDAKGQDEVLGAASHQAILCYTIEQRFPNFQPMIMKSEGIKLNADKHSHFLSDDLRKSGHDIYSVQNNMNVDFFITKQDIKVGSANTVIEGNLLLVKTLDASKEFLNSLSGAVSEKALSSGLKGVKVS
jgi:hypothetical protein